MYENHLIYGKDETEGIVALEVKDNEVYAYFNDGRLLKQPAIQLICATYQIDKDFERLQGENDFRFVKRYVNLETFKADKKRFWRMRDSIWSVSNNVEAHMLTRGTTLFKGLKVDQVSRLGFDIEADGLTHHKDSIVYMISNTFRDCKGTETKKVFRLDNYTDCGEMLQSWCNYVREIDPTLLVGHNVIGYDFPYLNHVASLYNIDLNLGRDESKVQFSRHSKNYRVDGAQTWEYKDIKVFGRHVIDTMFLAVKYDIGKNFPSWGLKPIIEHLGMVKEGREFYDASKIHANWQDPVEREKIVQYGIDDGDDCLNLYELMIPSFFYLTQSLPKPFQLVVNSASGSWINFLFLRAYLQDCRAIPKASEVDGFEGAISYGVPGVYSNCFKQDVSSLYPSIMRQHKICNEKKDPMRYFPKVVEFFTLQRLENKKIANETNDPYYKALEQSQKIVINSAYGFLGARGVNFNSPKDAALVTKIGRDILTKALVWSTNRDIDYWKSIPPLTDPRTLDTGSELTLVNCDTDSIMIAYKDGRKWTPEMKESFLDEMNDQFEDLISWEDDGEYDKVVVLKAKNYVLLESGQNKLKYKGGSFKDSKKEPAMKEMMYSMASSLIYENRGIVDIYEEYIAEILDIKDISRWCTKKSITENLLEADSTSKTKVLDAIEGTEYRVGDKVYLFNDIDGEVQHIVKGLPVIMKSTGKPKMVENRILRRREDFNNSYDLKHYLGRAYSTVKIFENIIDINLIKNYKLSKHYKELVDKT